MHRGVAEVPDGEQQDEKPSTAPRPMRTMCAHDRSEGLIAVVTGSAGFNRGGRGDGILKRFVVIAYRALGGGTIMRPC
jgi:hypothetical protein